MFKPFISSTAKFPALTNLLDEFRNGSSYSGLDPEARASMDPFLERLQELSRNQNSTLDSWRAREEYLDTLFAALPCMISYRDRELNYHYVNQAFEHFFGIDLRTFPTLNTRDVLSPEVFAEGNVHFQRVLLGEECSFESKLHLKNGELRYTHMHLLPDRSPDGTVQGFFTIADDITSLVLRTHELEQEQSLVSVMMNGIPALIGHWGNDLRNIRANQQYQRVFGRTPEQLKGTHVREMLGNTTFEQHEPLIQATLKGEAQVFEHEVRRPDGTTRMIRVNLIPNFSNGRVDGYFSHVVDVTEERESAIRLEQLTNNMGDVFWMTDIGKTRMAYVSPAYEEVWGRSCDSLYSAPHSFLDAIHPDDRERVMKAMARQTSETYDERYRILRPDGSTRWIQDRAYPLKDKFGEVRRVAGIARDITQEVEIIQQLGQRESDLMEAQSLAQLGSWTLKLSNQNATWSKELYHLFKRDPASGPMSVDAFMSRLSPQDRESLASAMKSCIEQGAPFCLKSRFQLLDRTVWLECRGQAVKDPTGKVVELRGTSQDITERMALEEKNSRDRALLLQSSKMASLGEMSAGLAHEINNPLAIISGSLGLLESYLGDHPKVPAMIAVTMAAVDRIAKIIEGLKKFSKTSETRTIKRQALSRIIRDASVLTNVMAKRHQTLVETELEGEAWIECDEREIEQAILNIVNNAIYAAKERPEKWVKIKVSKQDGKVAIRVTDAGSGIPEELKSRIFEPFFTTKPVGQGTGLGLSIAKGLVEANGGQLTIVPDMPNTCFEITLPSTEPELGR